MAVTYSCSKCGCTVPREELTVKKVMFLEMGSKGALKRSRVEAWLCGVCLVQDPVWKQNGYSTRGARVLEEVNRARQEKAMEARASSEVREG